MTTQEWAAGTGGQPYTGSTLPDYYGWENDPVLKGYLGSPYSPDRPANTHSNAYEAIHQVKSGQTLLYGFTAYNSNAAAQFIQLFDRETTPATGAVPAAVFTVAGASNLGAAWTPVPRLFLVGCWIANSSTGPTYTAGAADCFFDVQYL